jgi:hypothetical protein
MREIGSPDVFLQNSTIPFDSHTPACTATTGGFVQTALSNARRSTVLTGTFFF